jgi:F420-non-reducing hydrogenase small subunit
MDFKYKDVEAMPDGRIDVCLFNGAIRNEENEEIARLLRRKSKIMVAYGACSMVGGIPGMANLFTRDEIFDRVYGTTESTDNPEGVRPRPSAGKGGETALPGFHARARALNRVVDVDYCVPGCPPEAQRTWEALQALAAGDPGPRGSILGAGDRSVCDECSLVKRNVRVREFKRPHEVLPDGENCLLEQGVVCMGPATRSGCEARCPGAGMPCRGCYGPAGNAVDQAAAMIGLLGSIIDSEDEEEIKRAMDTVADPSGSFYRFGLPASLPGCSAVGGRRP